MNVVQDFIPAGRNNRPGILMQPVFITIHDTANASKGADALMHAKYLKGDECANRPASWHFTVDDKQIVQHLPLNEVAWHAGDGNGPGNMTSIAIEICENADGDRDKAEDNAAWLASDLLKRFSVEDIVQHNHWSGKNCPHVIRARENGWNEFLERVNAYMDNRTFKDVNPGAWYAQAVKQVSDAGIMNGYPDGTWRPDEPVTRKEMAVIIAKMKGAK